MTTSSSQEELDWRIRLGLTLTGGWLLLGIGYLSRSIGWANIHRLPADELGSFLEGAFAPLAFLWLVIGYFLQQRELQQNSAALQAQAIEIQRTAEQAVIQSEKMAQTEQYARQESFLLITQRVSAQLGTISGLLFISSQSAQQDGTVDQEEISRMFSIRATQDVEIFSRRLLEVTLQVSDEEIYALFYGTPIRARHSNHFIFAFERLMRRATELEADEMIRDSLLSSAHAFLYSRMKRQQANAPEELSNHEKTGIFFNM
ncbi:MAG: hypothetical protein AAGG11_18240 [Pseudomonadota bacterium]